MHCCKILLDRTKNIEEHPCHALLPIRFDEDSVDVRIMTCSMLDSNTGYSMIKIVDDKGSIKEGRTESDFGECTVTRIGNSQYMAMVINRRCLLAGLINHAGCFLSSAVPMTDTLIEWTIIGPDSKRISELFADMKLNGYSFELISSNALSMNATLTPKQEHYFNIAMDLGYYDVPKRITLDELSRILGCSKSTLNVSLRTAESNIFHFYRNVCLSNRFYKKS